MLIDPRHLEHLAVIIDVGTLQLAAVKIGTSQPALSRMISNLEKRIETPLFERSTRPIKPTPIGLELAQQGRSIRTARLRAAEVVDLGARGYLGILKIGAPPFLCKNLMSEAIASFLSARPNVRIDLIPDYQVGLMERVYLNQVDIAVGPSKFVAEGDTDLILDPLFKDRNVIVGRKDHPLLQAACTSTTEFSDATWVGHSEKSTLRADMEASLRQIGVINPAVACQSGSAEAVLELLRVTNFLTVLPRYAIRPDGSDGLTVAKFRIPSQELEINAISLVSRTETSLATDFKRHLKTQVSARYSSGV
ncbi:DNA-binding transcriptional regulator, LysR family [Octadecabacter temperatus]|jgi:DNA-binding transcriptional LysR family regulator|uniref:HTH-type transcriptional regulator CynR n=1 Tax=Octadecabacter temperatus TaxID=1458307 RepID=A0A0K0Y658_9RHOB|nr:LysR family transcriptional regulator [Octadecabacter temperatus]AKS46458.1 HTH-type transcriptional regulator CynR [Octadecabacter temperatus]SIO14431.1 DNA-binding transcriptional regulator, LysR family [Octadecabacter temperatus]